MATLRVGILNDIADGPPGLTDIERWLRLAVRELTDSGRLKDEVEFIHAWGMGLPSGTAAAVERSYAELVAKDVLLIVGPAVGDNAIIATPLAERHRVPTINWAGAETARSEYMFHLQVGSHEDESIVLAHYFKSRGLRRVGVVYDQSPIGTRHLHFLQKEAEILGFSVTGAAAISPLAENAGDEVAQVLASKIDAFVYLGYGVSAPAVARALAARGWDGPRAMNTAGLRGYHGDFAAVVDGWVYVDMRSDHNATLAAVCRRENVPAGRITLNAAKGYDLGRLVAEGLSRAPAHTREGIKAGLEHIKWLPAAEGYEGTLLGFGIYDRGALHGRYLVLRQWRDRTSIEVQQS